MKRKYQIKFQSFLILVQSTVSGVGCSKAISLFRNILFGECKAKEHGEHPKTINVFLYTVFLLQTTRRISSQESNKDVVGIYMSSMSNYFSANAGIFCDSTKI